MTFSERKSVRGKVREDLTGEAACQMCQVVELQGQRDGVRAARERSCQTTGCREKPQNILSGQRERLDREEEGGPVLPVSSQD